MRERSVVIRCKSVIPHDLRSCIGRASVTPLNTWRFRDIRARHDARAHSAVMTLPDLPERPGHASETRQMVERARTDAGANFGGTRTFLIALAVIAVVI